MAAYVIGDIEVTDPAAFQSRNRVGATVDNGGRFVVRGGRVNPKEETAARHLLMLEFLP